MGEGESRAGGLKVRLFLGQGGRGGRGATLYLYIYNNFFFSDTSHLRNKSNRLMSHFVNYSLTL